MQMWCLETLFSGGLGSVRLDSMIFFSPKRTFAGLKILWFWWLLVPVIVEMFGCVNFKSSAFKDFSWLNQEAPPFSPLEVLVLAQDSAMGSLGKCSDRWTKKTVQKQPFPHKSESITYNLLFMKLERSNVHLEEAFGHLLLSGRCILLARVAENKLLWFKIIRKNIFICSWA